MKVFKITVVSLLFLLNQTILAQVINTEKLRITPSDKKWTGDVNFSFGLNQNNAGQTINLSSKGRIVHQVKKNTWMLLGGYTQSKFYDIDSLVRTEKKFSNFQYLHLRYSRNLNQKWSYEAFTQEQWDSVQDLDIRILLGTGMRYAFTNKDKHKTFFGLSAMYEYEKNSPDDVEIIEQNARLSTYLSVGWAWDNLSINHISYFQPLLTDWSDFRVNSETSLTVKLIKQFTFKNTFKLIYDASPPTDVRRLQFRFNSGLGWEF